MAENECLHLIFANKYPQILISNLISYLMIFKLPVLHLLPTPVTFLGEQLKAQAAVTLTRQLGSTKPK